MTNTLFFTFTLVTNWLPMQVQMPGSEVRQEDLVVPVVVEQHWANFQHKDKPFTILVESRVRPELAGPPRLAAAHEADRFRFNWGRLSHGAQIISNGPPAAYGIQTNRLPTNWNTFQIDQP